MNLNPSIIITKDLILGYDHQPLVRNINVTISRGEFIGILGPNGSGKSTFLKALIGLIKPISGEIKVLNSRIGYMPQMRTSLSWSHLTSQTLLQAVFHGTGYGLPILKKSQKKEIEKTLEMVEATSYANRPFNQLSGGEKQRIYLAEALLGQPDILLLDEPLSNLDPKYQDVFITLLNQIQRNLKVTILLTAHDPNPLLNSMNRVLFFANGKAALGEVNEIITHDTLSAMYGTPIEVIHLKNRIFVLSETQQNLLGEAHHPHD